MAIAWRSPVLYERSGVSRSHATPVAGGRSAQQYFQFTLLSTSPLRVRITSEYLFRQLITKWCAGRMQSAGEDPVTAT
ncbi:hypothetical protein LNP25_23290 [Klebsiella variicola subsp. variicola]|nr:hypothetical protein [Klebsiella variicola subsp. variicola]